MVQPIWTPIGGHGFAGFHRAEGLSQGEDRWVAHQGVHSIVVAIADGKGGIAGGAQAATLCCGPWLEALGAFPPDSARLCSEISLRDHEIHEDEEAGEASLAVVIHDSRELLAISVGDVEVWIGQSGLPPHRVSGRRRHGTAYEMGTSCALIDLARRPRPMVAWVALLSDGLLRSVSEPDLAVIMASPDPVKALEAKLNGLRSIATEDVTVLVQRFVPTRQPGPGGRPTPPRPQLPNPRRR